MVDLTVPGHTSGYESDEPAAQDPYGDPDLSGERTAARVRQRIAPTKRVEHKRVDKPNGGAEESSGEDEDQGTKVHRSR